MIRQATYKDLEQISNVHRICFPDSFISSISKYKFFRGGQNFYKEFIIDNPELFVVADDPQDGIVGFCMGYYMDKDDQMQNFTKKYRHQIILTTLLLVITFNLPTIKKIVSRIKHKPVVSDWTIVNDKYEYILNNQRGDLLSICVLPEYRGKGYAQGLMDAFFNALRDSGRKLCLLSVKTKNIRARKIYERNGFEIYRTRGEEGLTYMKLL